MKMKLTLVLALCAASAVMMFFQFGALTDVGHDYISKKTLTQAGQAELAKALPDWSDCRAEWSLLRVAFAVHGLCLILVVVLVLRLWRAKPKPGAK